MNQAVEENVVSPIAHAPPAAAEANPADVRLLGRWVGAMLIISIALGACLWTRMTVRQTALELDATRAAVAHAEIVHERLLVERALLRDPGRLADSAASLALVAPVVTEHLAAPVAENAR